MDSDRAGFKAVVVTSGATANSLGVVRAFGRRRIQVVLVDSVQGNVARHSKYVTRRVVYRNTGGPKPGLVRILLDLGKEIGGRTLTVNEARPRPERSSGGGGGGYGGGGGGGSRGGGGGGGGRRW